jgi:hypothetical protein
VTAGLADAKATCPRLVAALLAFKRAYENTEAFHESPEHKLRDAESTRLLAAVGAALPKQPIASEPLNSYANAVTSVVDGYAVLASQYRRGTLDIDGFRALDEVALGWEPVSAACDALPQS